MAFCTMDSAYTRREGKRFATERDTNRWSNDGCYADFMEITKEKIIEWMTLTQLATGKLPSPVEVLEAYDHAIGVYEELIERKYT